MPDDIEVPRDFMGRHLETPSEILEWVHEFLDLNAPISHEHGISFQNAAEPLLVEDEGEAKAIIYIPLPYLDFADVTTDALQRELAPAAPAGIKLEVKVMPPEMNDERESTISGGL